MAKIFPFSGLMYNKKAVGPLAKVMIPPYDVIPKEGQEGFYAVHPYNCIRLTLGKEFPGDTDLNNKYTRANAFFNAWMKNNIMNKDEDESIYIYEQKFKFKGKTYTRLGFIALFKLEELEAGRVYPHENTLTKPKQDRLDLLKATSANFEPIFSLYTDKEEKVSKILKKNLRRKPQIEVKDQLGCVNKIWKMTGKADVNKLTKEMAAKQLYIADGHHRYEAALKYRNEMKSKAQKYTGDEPYNFIMMYFTNIFDKGLLILPIHRLVVTLNLKEKINLENRITDNFDLVEFKFTKKTEGQVRRNLLKAMAKTNEGEHHLGMYIHSENKYIMLKLKNEKIIDKYIGADKPKDWRKLDVTILHALIVKDILGITDLDLANEVIKYVHDDDLAFDLVKEDKYQLAFFINPTKVEQVVAVADKFEKMPQKSTFFYPKLLTGLLMYKMPNPEKFSF